MSLDLLTYYTTEEISILNPSNSKGSISVERIVDIEDVPRSSKNFKLCFKEGSSMIIRCDNQEIKGEWVSIIRIVIQFLRREEDIDFLYEGIQFGHELLVESSKIGSIAFNLRTRYNIHMKSFCEEVETMIESVVQNLSILLALFSEDSDVPFDKYLESSELIKDSLVSVTIYYGNIATYQPKEIEQYLHDIIKKIKILFERFLPLFETLVQNRDIKESGTVQRFEDPWIVKRKNSRIAPRQSIVLGSRVKIEEMLSIFELNDSGSSSQNTPLDESFESDDALSGDDESSSLLIENQGSKEIPLEIKDPADNPPTIDTRNSQEYEVNSGEEIDEKEDQTNDYNTDDVSNEHEEWVDSSSGEIEEIPEVEEPTLEISFGDEDSFFLLLPQSYLSRPGFKLISEHRLTRRSINVNLNREATSNLFIIEQKFKRMKDELFKMKKELSNEIMIQKIKEWEEKLYDLEGSILDSYIIPTRRFSERT